MNGVRVCVLAMALVALVGCMGWRKSDRMWISKEKFAIAERIYNQTNSLDLTEKQLRDDPMWQQPQINEAKYRLIKKFHLESDRTEE
jgi:hypothetical protein